MSYAGDFRLGDTIDLPMFTTVNTSGVPTTLAGSPTIQAHVGNNTTQITAGLTLTVDFDGTTGLHHIRVVATTGNGYATASNYTIIIASGTVGGASVVGYVVGAFSIENRSARGSNVRKNQALPEFQFVMTDSTNHNPVTGKTVTCTRSIDGGAFATGALVNVAEVANGTYTVDFGAADLNGNVIVLRATAAASDDTLERIITAP